MPENSINQTPAEDLTLPGRMQQACSEIVNCGRCALLKKNHNDGFGVCGSHQRFLENEYKHPTVSLDQTCEHAKLSAKFDPDFARREMEKFGRAQEEDYFRTYGK